uniref:Uncharacterized protein n=1 Tax=Trichuris muris TaxID=70415 RepID=A0A5S6Q996_TRIMR
MLCVPFDRAPLKALRLPTLLRCALLRSGGNVFRVVQFASSCDRCALGRRDKLESRLSAAAYRSGRAAEPVDRQVLNLWVLPGLRLFENCRLCLHWPPQQYRFFASVPPARRRLLSYQLQSTRESKLRFCYLSSKFSTFRYPSTSGCHLGSTVHHSDRLESNSSTWLRSAGRMTIEISSTVIRSRLECSALRHATVPPSS